MGKPVSKPHWAAFYWKSSNFCHKILFPAQENVNFDNFTLLQEFIPLPHPAKQLHPAFY